MGALGVATGRIVLAVLFTLTWSFAGSQDSSSWWGWNPFGPSATTVAPDLSFLNGTNLTFAFPNMTVPVPSTPAPGWILNTWNSFINPFTGGSSRSLDQDSEIDESGNSNSSDFEDSIDNDGNCIDGNCTLGGDRFEHGRHIVVDTTPNKTSFSFNGTGLLWESNVEVLPSGIRWTGEWKVGRNLEDNVTEIDYPEHLEESQNSTAFNGSKSARALDSWNTTFANSSEYIYIVSDASSNRTGFGRDINGSEFDHPNVTGDNSTAYDVDARRTEVGRSLNINDTRNTSATSDNSDVDNSLDWNFNENCTDGNCTVNFGQPTEQLEGDDRSEHGRHIVFDVTPNRTHFSFNGTGLFWSSDVEVGPGGIMTARWKVGRDLDDNDTYSVNGTEIEYPEQFEESQNSTVLNVSKSARALDNWNATSDNSSAYKDISNSPNRTGFGRELNGSEFDHLNVTGNTSAAYGTSPRPEFGRNLDFNDTRNSSAASNSSISSDVKREDSGRLFFYNKITNSSTVSSPDNFTSSSLNFTSSDLSNNRSFRAIYLTNYSISSNIANSSSLNSSSGTNQGNVSPICNCPLENGSNTSFNVGDIQHEIEQDHNETSTNGTLCTCVHDRSDSSRSFDHNDTSSGIEYGNISSHLNYSTSNITFGEPGESSRSRSFSLKNHTSLDVGNSTSRNESGRSLDTSNSTIYNVTSDQDFETPNENFTDVPTAKSSEEPQFVLTSAETQGPEGSEIIKKKARDYSDADSEDSKLPFLKTPEERLRYHDLQGGEISYGIFPGEHSPQGPSQDFGDQGGFQLPNSARRPADLHYVVARNIRHGSFGGPESGSYMEQIPEYFPSLDSFRKPIASSSPVSPQGKDPPSKSQ